MPSRGFALLNLLGVIALTGSKCDSHSPGWTGLRLFAGARVSPPGWRTKGKSHSTRIPQ
jgi:hypothetical protein